LHELLAAKKIKAKTKWKDVYPFFSKDERYLNLLGNPGSNPLELFWDVVDILDEALEHHAMLVEKAFASKGKTFSPEITEETFLEILRGDSNVEQLSEAQLKNVYAHVSFSHFALDVPSCRRC
jgi:pre-mRNA-processing factor 40